MSGNLSTLGYNASPDLARGSPSEQAVATGQANIQAQVARNAATGGRRHRKYRKYKTNKYRGGGTISITPLVSTTNSYPTQYPPSATQHNLVSAQVANNVNGQGDGLNGGFKKYKRTKFSKKNFFNKLIGFMKKRKTRRAK